MRRLFIDNISTIEIGETLKITKIMKDENHIAFTNIRSTHNFTSYHYNMKNPYITLETQKLKYEFSKFGFSLCYSNREGEIIAPTLI